MKTLDHELEFFSIFFVYFIVSIFVIPDDTDIQSLTNTVETLASPGSPAMHYGKQSRTFDKRPSEHERRHGWRSGVAAVWITFPGNRSSRWAGLTRFSLNKHPSLTVRASCWITHSFQTLTEWFQQNTDTHEQQGTSDMKPTLRIFDTHISEASKGSAWSDKPVTHNLLHSSCRLIV